jgi:hypothetical protein
MSPRQSAQDPLDVRQPLVPEQRPSELELLGLAVEELAVDDHEARDERMFDALDWEESS